ncbi:hypothetical protein IE53DRAFT_385193 [Violaceomyces palustris]|uniref:Uncharacterized protein n=1 Tax=Violaceomyces palustris TaxID=1673888 RepID=A0ACD0P2M5_9BASI|nr:hypothetical protein IE53DRAFT_385193 [Violaceomyces palustris]
MSTQTTTFSSLWSGAASESSSHCTANHDPVSMYLSLFLCVGLIISYLPQLFRIIYNKSSQGFSPWFLLLGATSSASSFLNVLALQWGVVRCCTEISRGACAESLLGIVQVALQWIMFVSVLLLFLIYYPTELRYERALILPGPETAPAPLSASKKAQRRVLAAVAAASGSASASSPRPSNDHLSAPKKSFKSSKAAANTTTEDESSISDNSDLDSIDSHIAENYSPLKVPERDDGESTSSEDGGAEEEEEEEEAEELTGEETSASVSQVDASSSAFSKMVPTFWPMWKAPTSSVPGAIEEEGLAGARPSRSSSQNVAGRRIGGGKDLLKGAPKDIRRIGYERRARQKVRKGPKGTKRKTPEWSLALALAWVVLMHFVFIFSITMLLVLSLPAHSFPSPDLQRPDFEASHHHAHTMGGTSSRLLVQRWAGFLGASATILAAGQYLPQIVHTWRTKLVGSLSIPMMCLQVPGSAIFVYSLAIRPGTDWSSLAAYVLTGFLQLVLLILCISWRIRQHRAGIDDYGRPLVTAGVISI